jgi:hypothetical protein
LWLEKTTTTTITTTTKKQKSHRVACACRFKVYVYYDEFKVIYLNVGTWALEQPKWCSG